MPQAALSTPTMQQPYRHPQASYSAEYVAAFNDPMLMNYPPSMASPIMSPSTSWTTDMSSNMDKSEIILDRRSISQGMKLVSIAADEYDEGNETVALDIYLTGIDKILMALPNKTDSKTKTALREKLLSVEERVGILNLANQRIQCEENENNSGSSSSSISNSLIDSLIIGKISQTIQSVTQSALRRTSMPANDVQYDTQPLKYSSSQPSYNLSDYFQKKYPNDSDTVQRFKQFSQAIIQATVTLAILVKQSPIPGLLAFCLSYFMHLLLWVDACYGIREKAQDFGIASIKLLIEADEQYRLHEFISEFIFMIIAATLKAVVAYKETPRYSSRPPPNVRHSSSVKIVEVDDVDTPNNNNHAIGWAWPSRR
ncbi:unnamed protein product [Cunninghamella echinulata]